MKRTFWFWLVALALLSGCPSSPDPEPVSTPVAGAPIDAAPTQSPTPPKTGPNGLKVAPTDPAERAKLEVEAPQPSARDGYVGVTFSKLADFEFKVDDMGRALEGAKLPDEIAQLDGQKVALSGFLVPIEFDQERVSSLILVRNQLLCCYGEEPGLNEWVWVNIDPPVEAVTDVPVTLFGQFHASPDEEDGQVISLYRMGATAMEVMK